MQPSVATTTRALRVASPLPASESTVPGTTTRTVTHNFPPELLQLIDHDPRFAIHTVDGRWLDPYTGEAIAAPQGLRNAALKRMANRSDWRQRHTLGMGELAVRKHFYDLELVIPRDDRLRVIETASGCWVNPYSGRAESTLRVEAATINDPEKRLVMARILSRTPEMRLPIKELAALLQEGRAVIPVSHVGSPSSTTSMVAQPASTRTATAVFRQLPQIPGWDFGVFASSHHAVGGDFYEIHPLDQDQVLVALGDVSGHGMQGAQAANALLKHLRRSLSLANDLPRLATELNEATVQALAKGKFITLFLCCLNVKDGTGRFISCGHHRPLMLSPGREHMVSMPGGPSMALGLVAGSAFDERIREQAFTLRHGDWLVQCSDGVIEAAAGDGELFGITRYAGTALAHADDKATSLTKAIADAAIAYARGALDDDCTVLAVRRLAPQHSA